MTCNRLKWALLLAMSGAVALAQPQPLPAEGPQGPPPPAWQPGLRGPQQGPPPDRGRPQGQVSPPLGPPPPERALLPGPHGKWWDDPETSQRLSLTSDQRKRMDDVFQQYRLKLIDLHASVQKEDAIMEPLVGADQPDESKIIAQIDKVALARAELEKANARMLLAIRRVLSPEQFQKLQPPQRQGNTTQMPHPPRKK